MAVNKVVYNGSTLVDLTDTTAQADDVKSGKVFYSASGKRSVGSGSGSVPVNYASSQTVAGPADKAVSIPFGQVATDSVSTAFTAEIEGIAELRDGICVMLKNGVVTSASGWTLNINGLGAKPVYSTMGATTRITTTFNVNYTMLFIYNSTRVSGGCWDMYYGYNAGYTNNVSQGQGYAVSTSNAKACTATLSSYALVAQGIVAVRFANAQGIVAVRFANAVPAGATLNINSKGAKAVYYRGAAIADGVIRAGDIATFIYNGSQYILLAVDRNAAPPEKLSDLTNDIYTTHTMTITYADGTTESIEVMAAR